MRTEQVVTPKLEFVPVPESLTETCTVSDPPLTPEGKLLYTDIPAWTAEVLGILELCNIKLAETRRLMEEAKTDGNN